MALENSNIDLRPPDLDTEITSVDVTLTNGDREVVPVYSEEVEQKYFGNSTSYSNQCGKTNYAKNGNKNWRVTFQGLITKDQLREITLMDVGAEPTEIISDGISGMFEVDTFTATQTDDINTYTHPDGTEELCFAFQLQTKKPDSEEGGI